VAEEWGGKLHSVCINRVSARTSAYRNKRLNFGRGLSYMVEIQALNIVGHSVGNFCGSSRPRNRGHCLLTGLHPDVLHQLHGLLSSVIYSRNQDFSIFMILHATPSSGGCVMKRGGKRGSKSEANQHGRRRFSWEKNPARIIETKME
jgi:hypothetical protein